MKHAHVITLIHLPGGRFTVDCPSRNHHDGLWGGWFHMNIPTEAEAGQVIANHRRQWVAGFRA